jgi:phospholipid/cholesterol/gamma-HCH transport system substrate-binding protein
MNTKAIDSAKLGLFVMAGIAFLVLTLYMIGKNRNLFGSTFTIRARMENVNGLLPGNNVRFRGIDVGTVKNIEIADDTSIFVTLTIARQYREHIKQNAVAAIGTDGLMGNKLININTGEGHSVPVSEGMTLRSLRPIETDEMLRTLNTTNNNIAVITENLQQITGKLNRNNSLWSLLGDTLIAQDLTMAVKDIRQAGKQTAFFTSQAQELIVDLRHGEGLAGALLTDTLWKKQLGHSFGRIETSSKQLSEVLASLKDLMEDVNNGKGTAGKLVADTLWTEKIDHTLTNLEDGTGRFNENMEALKHNFLFRRYFRKQEKKLEKEKNASNRETNENNKDGLVRQ